MHDDALERRLRDALSAEAGQLPFTITAAELERRAALRSAGGGNRRLTLLLAAAVAIGVLTFGGFAGGLLDRQAPAPTSPVAAQESPASSSPASAATATPRPDGPMLPGLDQMLAVDPEGVLIAQAHGPADGAFEATAGIPGPTTWTAALGTVFGGTTYRISVACIGPADLVLDVRPEGSRGPRSGPAIRCDGAVVERTEIMASGAAVSLSVPATASWRIVVRGDPRPIPLPTANPVIPRAEAELEELIRVDDQVLSSLERWGDSGMLVRGYGTLPYREAYGARLWCPPGSDVRLVFGTQTEPLPTAMTETHLACDGTVHRLDFGLPSMHAVPLYVAAAPGTRFSLLVTSETPPVATVRDVPGWRLVNATEPELALTTMRTAAGAPIDGGGPLRVVIDCAGPDSIDVNVDVKAPVGLRTFVARCSSDGTTTSQTFEAQSYRDVLVFYDTERGTWTALSLFIPE